MNIVPFPYPTKYLHLVSSQLLRLPAISGSSIKTWWRKHQRVIINLICRLFRLPSFGTCQSEKEFFGLIFSGGRPKGSKRNLKFQKCHVITSTFTINFFFLVPSFHSPVATSTFKFFYFATFHSPWINVTVINYIDNKRNSITIHFLLCCHKYKYSRWSGWACFFLAIIITIMEGLGLFFSCCHKYSRWWDLFAFWSQALS